MCAEEAEPIHTVLLSGGVDSASLLALVGEQADSEARALFVDYGQRALEPERAAATALAESFSIELSHARLDIGPVKCGEIKGRNALLVHTALAMSPRTPATIMIGIHAGSLYHDCTPAFVDAMQASLDVHSAGTLQLAAPFLHWSKREVYDYALAAPVPLELTYSCETGSRPPCGDCPSCHDRELLDAR